MNDDDSPGLGASFYLKIAGVSLVIGVAAFIVAWIFFETLFALGVLGAFGFLAAVSLGAAWLMDRRQARHQM